MNGETLSKLKMDDALRKALIDAANVKLSAEDIVEQKVSFVFGQMDAEYGITKEQIRSVITSNRY